jgi:hypothetical protein
LLCSLAYFLTKGGIHIRSIDKLSSSLETLFFHVYLFSDFQTQYFWEKGKATLMTLG